MPNPNRHIEKYLDYYIDLRSAPDFAVLVKGLWGSGKTWLVRDFCSRRHEQNTDLKFLHISLYGVATIRDIENRLLEQLYFIASDRGGKTAGKLTALLAKVLSRRLTGDSESTQELFAAMMDLVLRGTRPVLVFDDLERCAMPVRTVLGYINQFVEHRGLKVLIVANEDEIAASRPSTDGTSAEDLPDDYRRMKEKLIGKSLQVTPRPEIAFESFTTLLDSSSIREFLHEHVDIFLQLYRSSGTENLRSIRRAILEFARIYPEINSRHTKNTDLMRQLLSQFLAYVFEIQSGNVRANNLGAIREDYFMAMVNRSDDEQHEEEPLRSVVARYPNAALDRPLLPESVWEAFFDRGIVDSSGIDEALSQSPYYFEENTPQWRRLLDLWSLTDDEFPAILGDVRKDYSERRYDDPGIVKHIAGLLLWLAHKNLIPDDIDTLVAEAKAYADHLKKENMLAAEYDEFGRFADNDHSHGVSYWGNTIAEFPEILQHFRQSAAEARVDALPGAGVELLPLMSDDPGLFRRRLLTTNSSDNLYFETPILAQIPHESFVNALLASPPDNWRTIAGVFKERYTHIKFAQALVDELPWLREIRDDLEKHYQKCLGKLSAYRIRSIIDNYIDPAIILLSEIETSHGASG